MGKPLSKPGSGNIKRVAVLVDTSTAGAAASSPASSNTRRRGNWHLFVEARGLHDSTALPRDWQGDGIIARIGTPEVAGQLRRRRIPVVNVSGIRLPGKPFPASATTVRPRRGWLRTIFSPVASATSPISACAGWNMWRGNARPIRKRWPPPDAIARSTASMSTRASSRRTGTSTSASSAAGSPRCPSLWRCSPGAAAAR